MSEAPTNVVAAILVRATAFPAHLSHRLKRDVKRHTWIKFNLSYRIKIQSAFICALGKLKTNEIQSLGGFICAMTVAGPGRMGMAGPGRFARPVGMGPGRVATAKPAHAAATTKLLLSCLCGVGKSGHR
jgi:hypothetical protein